MFKKILWNSITKTILILIVCSYGTYYVIFNHAEYLISLFNWRSKEFWKTVAIAIPAIMLFPILLNGFFFLSITSIADDTKQTNKLLKQQNELLQKLIDKTNK